MLKEDLKQSGEYGRENRGNKACSKEETAKTENINDPLCQRENPKENPGQQANSYSSILLRPGGGPFLKDP
jgi:hypothetical protein